MFSQFRVRYPTGSLISELITIDRGQYIVRAQVVVDGVVLSSGLAAAETVEGAEDRAKNRALAGIELGQTSLSTATSSFSTSAGTQPTSYVPPAPTTSSPLPNTGKLGLSSHTATISQSLPNGSDDWLSHSSETESWDDPEPPPPPTPPKSMPAPSSSAPQASVGGYRDLSDEVAKMKVELARLHWTPEQGKQHLMKTYNKSSSKDLTDEEFFDFLHYLESQPTPTGKK
jgi:hypothetical protein